MTILTYVQNIWQIGYVVHSLLMGYNRYSSDIEWHDYKQHDFVPKYSPPQNTERNYSPELLAILTAMLQCKVDARPTAQEVMEAIKKDMPRFTQGMERWGTKEWFEELDCRFVRRRKYHIRVCTTSRRQSLEECYREPVREVQVSSLHPHSSPQTSQDPY